ncbi:MAG: DUF86 domain-containing protein [Caldilineaceae bacterium]|nr:DUF86 domain-containing protein [Caldilineaceae bacterium]
MLALDGYTLDKFRGDWEKRLVIERLIEIIGEAANRLTPEFVAAASHIPWPQIVGMRNIVSHEYFRVDSSIIWRTAIESIPPLHREIEQLILQSSQD